MGRDCGAGETSLIERVNAMQKIIAANWKMFKTRAEARETAAALVSLLAARQEDAAGRLVIVYPPFTAIAEVADVFAGMAGTATGAQDVYPAEEGAFTGEISPRMLADAGATWVLTGHSERRHVLGESDELVGRKTAFALEQGLSVMLCVGETLAEREAGQLAAVLERQLAAGVANVASERLAGRFAVAYEPVWAIGTGKVAGPEEAGEAHALVRQILRSCVGPVADETPLLYGGSVKPANAAGLLALDNVDGLLVGGASLDANSFAQIIFA